MRPLAAIVALFLCVGSAAGAQLTADQVLTELGFSAAEKQSVLKGEFVTAKIGAVSERDLSFAISFFVKASPEAISKQLVDGALVAADDQVQTYGKLSPSGSLADFPRLKITDEEAHALLSAGPGGAMNRSTGEHASFKALRGGSTPAVLEQRQRMLLARYQSYRTSGLTGIAPYDRGGGFADVAADLTKATHAATAVQKHMPALYALLLDYPRGTLPGMQENFFWVKSIIRDKPTYVLAQILIVADGEARAVVRREFYVSTGYNAEQSVAGAAGSMKRSIGSRVMAGQMKEIFEKGRKGIER